MTRTPCHLPRRRRGSWDGAGPWKPEGGSPRPTTPSSLPSSFSAAAGPAPLPRVREKPSPFPAAGAPAALPPARCGAQWVPFATVPERRPAASRPHSSQARTAARTCLPVLADPRAQRGGGGRPRPGAGTSPSLQPAAPASRARSPLLAGTRQPDAGQMPAGAGDPELAPRAGARGRVGSGSDALAPSRGAGSAPGRRTAPGRRGGGARASHQQQQQSNPSHAMTHGLPFCNQLERTVFKGPHTIRSGPPGTVFGTADPGPVAPVEPVGSST